MKSRIEETANRWIAELLHATHGEHASHVEHCNGAAVVLCENGRVYRVTARVAIEELA